MAPAEPDRSTARDHEPHAERTHRAAQLQSVSTHSSDFWKIPSNSSVFLEYSCYEDRLALLPVIFGSSYGHSEVRISSEPGAQAVLRITPWMFFLAG